MPVRSINLVVTRTSDFEASLKFYRALGLDFTAERHGTGPEHFAATVGGTVFEIYPAGDGSPSQGMRLGFSVDAVDATIERLKDAGGRVLTAPADSPWGRRAVVEAPEGTRVELFECR